jgi:zinc protease
MRQIIALGLRGAFVIVAFAILPPTLALAQTPTAKYNAVWAHAQSDLKPDPAVLFGTLPNGMRYAILKNATPAGQASVRFHIGSGSLQESDAQQGLAHFLEHMAFKGSAHVPEDEMVRILQRKGLAFGADTNASTDFNQTLYKLDLPETDASTVDASLMLMREIASELTLADKALETERGVVTSEERQRDTPAYRAGVAQFSLQLDGQLAARRLPIGKMDVVRQTPASLMRDYYQANYRPERAALIFVGDIDPAEIAAKIKTKFADWRPVGAETPEPDVGTTASRGLTVKVVELPGAAASLQMAWARPFDGSIQTEAKVRVEFLEVLARTVLNRRFSKLIRSEHAPFLSAAASIQNIAQSARITAIEATFSPDAWRPALAAIEQEQRRLVLHGVSQEELDRAIAEMRMIFQNMAAGATTRRTPDLADMLIRSVNDREVATSPAQDLASVDKIMTGLTAAEVSDVARRLFEGAGPLVSMTTPTPPEGGDATLAAEYAKVHAEPVTALAAQTALVWPYSTFGAPGSVVERKDVSDLGVVFVRFANGVKLTVKQTNFSVDQVLASVRVGDGMLDLAKDRPNAKWSSSAFLAGGLKTISSEDVERVLAGKFFTATFTVGEDAFVLTGRTRPQDLDVQLQTLAAFTVDAAFRPEAFERVRSATATHYAQLEATASGVFSRDLQGLLHAQEPRWVFPSRELVEAAKPDELKELLQGPLAAGLIEVTLVGDITPEVAIERTAAVFGALPSRAETPLPADRRTTRFPEAVAAPIERFHKGRVDDAVAFIAWPTTDVFADTRLSFTFQLLNEALQNRLREQLRNAEGATYSPQGESFLSFTFPGYGYVWIMAETPPSRIASFYANVSKITAAISADGVTEDEFVRARTPIVEQLKKAQLSNEYWLGSLWGAQTDGRRLDLIRSALADYEKITAVDVKRVAALYLQDSRAWKMVVLPAASAAVSPGASSGGGEAR